MGQGKALPLLELPDRAALRAWLSTNHATSQGVHLAVANKSSVATRLTYEDAILEALSFGWIDSTSHALDAGRHTVMFVPRRPGGTWARTNKARVAELIEDGLMTPAGLAAIEAAKADGSWTRLDDVEDLAVPDDLAAALAAGSGAAEAWDTMTESRRRMSLYRIASAKRPETRARRIAEVVRAAGEGRPLP
jgi:uncharacterized protein YdeI (YjbR/CyaY-like superfamily)